MVEAITKAVNVADVVTGIGTIGGTLALLYVARMGVSKLLGMIR